MEYGKHVMEYGKHEMEYGKHGMEYKIKYSLIGIGDIRIFEFFRFSIHPAKHAKRPKGFTKPTATL